MLSCFVVRTRERNRLLAVAVHPVPRLVEGSLELRARVHGPDAAQAASAETAGRRSAHTPPGAVILREGLCLWSYSFPLLGQVGSSRHSHFTFGLELSLGVVVLPVRGAASLRRARPAGMDRGWHGLVPGRGLASCRAAGRRGCPARASGQQREASAVRPADAGAQECSRAALCISQGAPRWAALSRSWRQAGEGLEEQLG